MKEKTLTSIKISEETRILINKAKGKLLNKYPATKKVTFDTIINIAIDQYIKEDKQDGSHRNN
jgi:hypothetical protein